MLEFVDLFLSGILFLAFGILLFATLFMVQKVARQERRRRRAMVGDPEAKALELLRSWLSPEQLHEFDHSHQPFPSFCVVGSASGRSYRITWGRANNVMRDDDGLLLCFLPDSCGPVMRLPTDIPGLPTGDILLAQKHALEHMEEEALFVARNFLPISGFLHQATRGLAAP